MRKFKIYVKSNGIPQYVIIESTDPTLAQQQAIATYGRENVIGLSEEIRD